MFIASLILLVVVGLSAALISTRLNRRQIAALESARTTARNHLVAVSRGNSLDAVLLESGVAPPDLEGAKRIIEVIPRTLGLADLVPPADLPLADVFRVHVIEQGVTVSQSVTPTQYVEPFAYDLVANLLSVIDKRLWKRRQETDAAFPTTEDALADLIMGMTVGEFVTFFVPFVEAKS